MSVVSCLSALSGGCTSLCPSPHRYNAVSDPHPAAASCPLFSQPYSAVSVPRGPQPSEKQLLPPASQQTLSDRLTRQEHCCTGQPGPAGPPPGRRSPLLLLEHHSSAPSPNSPSSHPRDGRIHENIGPPHQHAIRTGDGELVAVLQFLAVPLEVEVS